MDEFIEPQLEPDDAGMEISAAGDIPEVQPSERRAVALDILRGMAILMMVFASYIPFDKPLPRWLFHAQEPPSYDVNHQIVHIYDPAHAGLTFVDLVFPLFLFALGAAIPLALAPKLDNGQPLRKTMIGALQRMASLIWFALYLGHIRPSNLHDTPTTSTWLIALLGYALLYPMFTRLPRTWPRAWHWLVRGSGFGGGALLVAVLSAIGYYPRHAPFGFWRTDIIIVSLANMAFFGTVIWVATRGQIAWRLGVLSGLAAILLGASESGWLQDFWGFTPHNTGWVFEWDFLKYLLIVIPGTIAGDLVHQWITTDEPNTEHPARGPLAAYVALTVALIAGTLGGLQTRKLWQTSLLCAVACADSYVLLRRPADSTQRLARTLMLYGTYWLMIGIVLQPLQGGIKKDPATLSYFFVTSGLAFFLLSSLLLLTATFKLRRPFTLLADSGRNPMIAYTSMDNFVFPILALARLQPVLDRAFANRWMGVLLAAIETLVLAWFVSLLSRRKVFWRT